jgi:hypothetical protein
MANLKNRNARKLIQVFRWCHETKTSFVGR